MAEKEKNPVPIPDSLPTVRSLGQVTHPDSYSHSSRDLPFYERRQRKLFYFGGEDPGRECYSIERPAFPLPIPFFHPQKGLGEAPCFQLTLLLAALSGMR